MLKLHSNLKKTAIAGALLLSLTTTPALAIVKPLEAGPIANAQEAKIKCPRLAQQQNASWTGKWWSIASGNMAVCEIDVRKGEYNAGGFIANQQQAAQRCQATAGKHSATWTGQWRVTIPGQMAVCSLSFGVREIDVGFIRNQGEANLRCKAAALREDSVWTGKWRTQGNTSFCELNT
ncbi:MAG: Unknown protein [uncultured Thiotrichaceae bacterium]|uniref:Mannan-binding protein domain-containing protein n=1 Tax=uncultured Thiotrichaceae bacterium TaxID=298394 RepID=A0A6S6SV36_9GAMM|nr:MAG: Unknown protein [uncultured Thiotrichaceae bacterium]